MRANTNAALLALANNLPYKVTKYNRRTAQHEIFTVQLGHGCVRLTQELGHSLGHDGVPKDIHATEAPKEAYLRGQFPGSAMWSARLFQAGEVPSVEGSWAQRISTSCHRPDEATLACAYNTYYGCGRDGCDNARCLRCSDEGSLQVTELRCTRFMRVSQAASCDTGRLRGGDAKRACLGGPVDEWVLGQGQGDDVEIFTAPPPAQAGPVEAEKLTIVKVTSTPTSGVSSRSRGGFWGTTTSGLGRATIASKTQSPDTRYYSFEAADVLWYFPWTPSDASCTCITNAQNKVTSRTDCSCVGRESQGPETESVFGVTVFGWPRRGPRMAMIDTCSMRCTTASTRTRSSEGACNESDGRAQCQVKDNYVTHT